jgi:hypothetical protein
MYTFINIFIFQNYSNKLLDEFVNKLISIIVCLGNLYFFLTQYARKYQKF